MYKTLGLLGQVRLPSCRSALCLKGAVLYQAQAVSLSACSTKDSLALSSVRPMDHLSSNAIGVPFPMKVDWQSFLSTL